MKSARDAANGKDTSASPVRTGPGGNVINPVTNKSLKAGIGGGVGAVPGDASFHLSPTELDALKRLQCAFRRVHARISARKVFIKTYVKKFDSSYGAVYYANVKDGSSSWDPPKIYKYLFPGKVW